MARRSLHPVEKYGDFADEVRRDLPGARPRRSARVARPASARPPLDVYETDDTVEIAVDLPGVDRGAVRVIVKGGRVLIAGEKPRAAARGESSFHLVERGYGRFARAVRARRRRATPPTPARRSPTASCGSSLPKIANAAQRARSSDSASPDRRLIGEPPVA